MNRYFQLSVIILSLIFLTNIQVFAENDWNYINVEGKIEFKTSYSEAGNFSEGAARVAIDPVFWKLSSKKKYHYINKKGEIILNLFSVNTSEFKDGVAVYEVEDKSGISLDKYNYFGKHGKNRSNNSFENIFSTSLRKLPEISDGAISITKWGCVGFVDLQGKQFIYPSHNFKDDSSIPKFSEGYARLVSDHYWGFIDKNNVWAISPEFEYVSDFHEGLAYFVNENKGGFINYSGEVVIKNTFSPYIGLTLERPEFSEGLCLVTKNKKYVFIDKKGEIKIDKNWSIFKTRVRNFKCGRAFFRDENNLWGIIDRTGKIIISPKYINVQDFSENLAAVVKNELYGFIDINGETILKDRYMKVQKFSEGLAAVVLSETKSEKKKEIKNEKLSFLSLTGIEKNSSLNIRKNPNIKGKILGKIPFGANKIKVLGETKRTVKHLWKKIEYNGIKGWVSSKFLKKEMNSSETWKIIKIKSDDHLNMRSGPSTRFRVLRKIPYNAGKLIYLNEQKKNGKTIWKKIKYNNVKGWVSSKFIEKE